MEYNGGAEADKNITANSVRGSSCWMQNKFTWMMLKVVTAVTYWGGIICSELLLLYSIVCMKTNKAGVRRNIQHLKWFQQSLLPCMNYWLDWDKNTDNRESIFNQGTQPFSTDEGEICLHYYCTGASLFVWAWFHHTFSKWQKGKLIL